MQSECFYGILLDCTVMLSTLNEIHDKIDKKWVFTTHRRWSQLTQSYYKRTLSLQCHRLEFLIQNSADLMQFNWKSIQMTGII